MNPKEFYVESQDSPLDNSAILPQTKWQLNQDAFDKLLAHLSTDREFAGAKYLVLRKNLVRFFETRNIISAEEATDEVLNRLAKKIQHNEIIENVNSYACGVARLVALEIYKKPKFEELPENFDQTKTFTPLINETVEKEAKLNCLEKCLSELSAENRQIVLTYYEGDGSNKIINRKKLGKKLGIPQNALCKRVVRLREKTGKMCDEMLRSFGTFWLF